MKSDTLGALLVLAVVAMLGLLAWLAWMVIDAAQAGQWSKATFWLLVAAWLTIPSAGSKR